MNAPFRSVRLALAALSVLALAACPQVPDADPLEVPPRIVAFTADQAEVTPGTAVKLTWAVENATSVKIDEVKLGLVSGVSGNSGTVDVAITEPALFVLTARNDRGASETAIVSVRITRGATQEVVFTALPNTIVAGTDTTLAWSAPGAPSVSIVAAPGGALDLGSQGSTGTLVVRPLETTTYTLDTGARTVTTTVTVEPTIVSFNASTLSADAGSTITLSWTTAGASRVRLRSGTKGLLSDSADGGALLSGTFDDTLPSEVDPGQLFPYELVVTGGTTTLTETVVISISGQPAVQTFTAPKYVSTNSDAGVALAWTTREASAVRISAGDVELYRAPPTAVAAGSVVVPRPANDTTYTITATHPRGGAATATASVDVVAPPTVMVVATPNPATAGQPVSLSWNGTDVRNVRLYVSGRGEVFSATDTMDTGSVPTPFTFANDEVIQISADNGAGDWATATTTLRVSDALQFDAGPGSVRAGEPFVLSWTPAVTITGLPHVDVAQRDGGAGWDDISSTGTAVSVTADGANSFQPTNFSAPFFDSIVGSQVWVASDGYMSFSPIGNGNYSSVAVPSAKLEPLSIAPCWSDITTSNLRWQVKTVTEGRVLIVQWDQRFQVKVFSTGRVDVDYNTLTGVTCTNRGVRGRYGDSGFAFAPTPVSGLGLTLFGPVTGAATMVLRHDAVLAGSYDTSNGRITFRRAAPPVVEAHELVVSEAHVSPAASLGQQGQWFELFNTSATPIDLTGWTLSNDAGVNGALAGTIAPGAVLVVGPTNDAALNDDAGVQLALAGFVTSVDAGSLTLGRDGGLSTFTWTGAAPGTAIVQDFGPYKFSSDSSSSVARPQTCPATAPFGTLTPTQLGQPGIADHCGFPYTWREVPSGYFDISTVGAKANLSSTDDSYFTLSLTAAPFPFFGTAQTQLRASTNGFITFSSATGSILTTNAYPSTTDANSVIAIFANDLIVSGSASGLFTFRAGPGVDPFASAPHWIVQWHRWGTYSSGSPLGDDLNFQVKLFDDGAIEYHFGRMQSVTVDRYATGYDSATWLENPAGTQALVINALSDKPGISGFTAFRFTPR